MRAHELIEKLKELGENRIVILSEDGEGNNFHPVAGVEGSTYVPQTTWRGDSYPEKLTQEMIEQGWSEDELYHGDKGQPAIVLWP